MCYMMFGRVSLERARVGLSGLEAHGSSASLLAVQPYGGQLDVSMRWPGEAAFSYRE